MTLNINFRDIMEGRHRYYMCVYVRDRQGEIARERCTRCTYEHYSRAQAVAVQSQIYSDETLLCGFGPV